MTYSLEMHEVFDCPRSAEDAFRYIVDFSRICEWDHTINSAKKVTDGAVGLGTKFDLEFAMGPRKVPIAYEVTEFEASHKAVLTGISANFTAVDTVTITPTENGCHVDWLAQLEFTGTSAKIVPFMANKIKKDGSKTIVGLAKALEDNYKAPTLRPLQKLADALILPGVMGFTRFGYSIANNHWNPVSANITGKHMVITGATSGLGLASARELAHRGATLTLVARDKDKADEVAAQIQQETGNSAISVKIADLSLMAEVIELADSFIADGKPVDVLINNAGALLNPRQLTAEGIEASFALLLLGPYILTEKLYPLLEQADGARVINVSSGGMYAAGLSLNNLESDRGEYRGADAYARSKRGLVIMGERWADRWQDNGITVHNMHPGWAHTPGVEVGLPEFTKITKRVLRTPEQGADTIVWLAHATEVDQTSGLFWLDRFPHTTNLTAKTRSSEEKRGALERALMEYHSRFERIE